MHAEEPQTPSPKTQLDKGTDFSFALSFIKPYNGLQRNKAAVQEQASMGVQYIHIQGK